MCTFLHSEQAKGTRELCFTFFTYVCSLACMWLILFVSSYYTKIALLEELI